MGTGCCGKIYEVDQGLLARHKFRMFRRARRKEVPALAADYISIPNTFGAKDGRLTTGLAGLENLGSTCYLNAALQCLSNVQPLSDYFLSGLYTEDSEGALSLAFGSFLQAQWMQEFELIIPKHLVNQVWQLTSAFTPGEQHDAHEFLDFLLNSLHMQLNRAGPSSRCLGKEDSDCSNDERQAARAWYEHLKQNSSIIVDLFQGQLKSSVKCSECDYQSVTFDTFMSLSVPFSDTLLDALAEFTKPETLTDDEKWKCLRCDKEVEAVKKIDIWKLPPILILHMKRFKFEKGGVRKVKSFMKYPVHDLDLREFVSSPQREPPLYNLFGKIDHFGNAHFGHYVAYCKNRNTQKWFVFDDELVEEVPDEELSTKEAYVLFYYKENIEEFYRQSTHMPGLWPHVLSKDITIHTEQSPVNIGSTDSSLFK